MTVAHDLTPTDVWPLAVAVLHDACQHVGAKALIIKGLAAHTQGLRTRATATDVDALIDPHTLPALITHLHTTGWQTRARDNDHTLYPDNAITLYHPNWPIDLDLHHRFLGFENNPHTVFEYLWQHHTTTTTNNTTYPTPHPTDHAILLIVNALRNPNNQRNQHELTETITTLHNTNPTNILTAATHLGATATAQPALQQLIPTPHHHNWGTPSPEWTLLTTYPDPIHRRAHILTNATWPQRIHMLTKWLTPTTDTLYKNRAGTKRTLPRTITLYLRRLTRTATHLIPHTLTKKHKNQ